jgi:group I intron endonuclease
MGCIYYGYYPDDFDESRDFPEKVYVGSTVEFGERTVSHIKHVKNGTHHSYKFQEDYHGQLPIFVIFENDIPNEDLLAWEQAAFEFFAYKNDELPYYNIAFFAGSTLGVKHSEEARKANSERQKGELSAWWGRKHTEETKRQISESNKGKILSEETRQKISEAAMGREYSQEYKDNMSISCQETHCKKGHEFTEENTIIEYRHSNGRTSKRCRICRNEYHRAYIKRRKLNE